MSQFKLSLIAIVTLLASLSCGGGGGGGEASGNVVTGGQGGQVVVETEAIQAAEAQRDSSEAEEEPETLSAENVDVEELNTESDEEVEEEEIDVATAEEDPLDGLLNALSVFQSCLEDEGFEFIGAPGQPGPDGETADPSSFTPDYLQALQKCATESNILESFQAFGEAQANLTTEQIEALNFGLPTFGECLERLGWTVGELIPDERGALSFGANGAGLTPPEDSEGLFPVDDINNCRQEATEYTEANYVADDEG